MKTFGFVIAAAALATGVAAQAQVRAPTPKPSAQPEYQAPEIDPLMGKLNSLQLQLNALKQSAGRQIVTLHFEPGQGPSTADNNFNTNQQNATQLCEQLLKDRYGRMLSYRIDTANEKFYLTHILCETKA